MHTKGLRPGRGVLVDQVRNGCGGHAQENGAGQVWDDQGKEEPHPEPVDGHHDGDQHGGLSRSSSRVSRENESGNDHRQAPGGDDQLLQPDGCPPPRHGQEQTHRLGRDVRTESEDADQRGRRKERRAEQDIRRADGDGEAQVRQHDRHGHQRNEERQDRQSAADFVANGRGHSRAPRRLARKMSSRPNASTST